MKGKTYEPLALRALIDMPIRRKLLVILMTVTAAALAVSGLGILVADAYLYRASLERDLSTLARITADNSTAALMFNVPSEAVETLNALRAKSHVVAACLYRNNGEEFARYVRPGSSAPCPAPAARDGVEFTKLEMVVSQPVIQKGERAGTLVMLYDLDELVDRTRLYGLYVLVVLLVSGLIAFFLASRLRGVIATPISQLAVIAAAVSKTKDYGIRARGESRDELGALVVTFNEMLAGIQSRDRELRGALVAREEALSEARKAHDFLRTTLASIGDAVISTDAAGCIAFANQAACSVLRRTEQEIAGHLTSDVLHFVDERTGGALESPVQRVLRGGGVQGFAGTILLSGDGTGIPIDYSAAPIRGRNGDAGVVLIFRDMTERRRAERELRSAREQLQLITDTMAAAVARCDRDMRFLWVSRRYAERLGLTTADFPGRTIGEMLGAEVLASIRPQVESVLAGQRVEYETRIRYRTIGWRWVRAGYVPTHAPDGAVDGWVADITDITEIKEAQAEVVRMNVDLKQSNESLARSNEDLERFAFAASHDLQEPLRMMTTYTQLLERSQEGRLEGEAKLFMRNIVDGALRMRELLTDLLAYSELGAEPEGPERSVDLNRVVEIVRRNLEAAVAESGAEIEAGPLPSVTGHPGHFVQLFQNLVSNAIKYRGDRPVLVRISCKCADGQLHCSVADNGMGIDPAYHERIFGVFKRLHGRKIPGTGIGLAICQRVVTRYGGRIWVESELGVGATFHFTIPLRSS